MKRRFKDSPRRTRGARAARLRVGAPHLDELAAEVTVEEQVAREVGLVADADVEQRQEALRDERLAHEAALAHVLAREPADVLARANREAVDVAVHRRAAALRVAADRLEEAVAVRARAVLDDVVQAVKQLEVDVDVIEQERVEHLAEQERRAGRAQVSRRRLRSIATPCTSRELPIAKMCVAPRRSAGAIGVFWRRPPSR